MNRKLLRKLESMCTKNHPLVGKRGMYIPGNQIGTVVEVYVHEDGSIWAIDMKLSEKLGAWGRPEQFSFD